METRFACGSMVFLFLFHKKIHVVNFFVKKSGVFRPAGGDTPRQIRDRLIHGSTGSFVVSFISWCSWSKRAPRNSCYYQDLRGARSNGPFALDTGVVRLWQHGTFVSFSGQFGSPSQIVLKKHVPFHPAGGESGRLSRQMPGVEPTT
jgi:hypothetical protein